MIEERYELAVGRIREIRTEQTVDGVFCDYFQKLADFVIMIDELRNVLSVYVCVCVMYVCVRA